MTQAGDAKGAADELKQVPADQRDRPFEYFLQGADLHRDGKLTEAIQRFEKVLTVQKSHLGAQYAIAVCYLKLRGPNRELE